MSSPDKAIEHARVIPAVRPLLVLAFIYALFAQNTGGKTAALKALGLAALMAKAGLYLPTPADEGAPLLCAYVLRTLCCTVLCMLTHGASVPEPADKGPTPLGCASVLTCAGLLVALCSKGDRVLSTVLLSHSMYVLGAARMHHSMGIAHADIAYESAIMKVMLCRSRAGNRLLRPRAGGRGRRAEPAAEPVHILGARAAGLARAGHRHTQLAGAAG